MIILTIDGRPVAKGRPRFTKSGHVFTPPKTKEFEDRLKTAATEFMIHQQMAPLECPINAALIFNFAVPKSASKKRQAELMEQPYTGRPDLDNLIKCIDAFNGILWKDDSQISSVFAMKSYGPEDSMTFIFHTEKDIYDDIYSCIPNSWGSDLCH